MNKVNSQMGYLGLVSAVLAAILVAWREGILDTNTRIIIFAGVGILTVVIVMLVDGLTQQTLFLPQSLAAVLCCAVILVILVQFGISLPVLFTYVATAAIAGSLIGLTRGRTLILLYPVLLISGLVIMTREEWLVLAISQIGLWQVSGLLAFYLLLFSALSPTLAASAASRMSALLILFLAVWYSPLAGMARGTMGKVSFIPWVVGLALLILLVPVVTAPTQFLFKKIWLAPRANALLFVRRSKRLLRDGSAGNIKAFSAIYSEAPTDLRQSIYSQDALQGNEGTWGKIICLNETQLGREALQNLSSLQAPPRSSLHSSLVAIFSQGVADDQATVWQASLKKLIELDKYAALQVCRELVEKNNTSPIEAYLAIPDEAAYGSAMRSLIDIAKNAPATVLARITDLMYKELHNASAVRAALVLREVKASSLIRSQVLKNLSNQFRTVGQNNAVILKDISLIDPDQLWAEVVWAAEYGSQRHILGLIQMEDDKILLQTLARIIDTVDEDKRARTLCGWLGKLLPAPSVGRSIALLLAISILSPRYCLQFLQEKAYQLPVEVLHKSLGKPDSPLRSILWQWMTDEGTNQSANAVKLVNWIAVEEGAAA